MPDTTCRLEEYQGVNRPPRLLGWAQCPHLPRQGEKLLVQHSHGNSIVYRVLTVTHQLAVATDKAPHTAHDHQGVVLLLAGAHGPGHVGTPDPPRAVQPNLPLDLADDRGHNRPPL